MTGRVKVGVAIAVSSLSILTLCTTLWMNRPFQVELASYRTSLADRTEAQQHNIRQAVMALDGVVIEPGSTLSFNETVGPRTPERGYREAAAFLERDLVTSIGGGVCQVASTLYNAAALSGLIILERHSHSRRVASVPPGRDATVWYGITDLKIKNDCPYPVRLSSRVANKNLYISFTTRFKVARTVHLYTTPVYAAHADKLIYQTVRTIALAEQPAFVEVLTRDIYAIN